MKFDQEKIFRIYLFFLVVFTFIGIIFLQYTGEYFSQISIDRAIRGLFLLFPYLFAIYMLFFIIKKDQNQAITFDPFIRKDVSRSFLYSFIIVYLVSIIYLNLFEKEFVYIVLLSLMYLIIFFQIIFTRTNPGIIIAELSLTFINSVLSALLRYPYYFAQSDTFYHVAWANLILDLGRTLPDNNFVVFYTYYPLFHIISASGAGLLNVPVLLSHNIFFSVIFALSILFCYLVFRSCFNERIALLACLFYSTASTMLTAALSTMVYCVAFVLFLLLIFIVLKINAVHSNRLLFIVLLIPISVALVFTHHASVFMILIVLLILYNAIEFLGFITGDKKSFILFPIVLMIVAFLIHWYYIAPKSSIIFEMNAKSFLLGSNIIEISDIPEISTLVASDVVQQNLQFVVANISSSVLLLFVVIGIGLIIRQKFNKFIWGYLILALFGLPLWIPLVFGNLKVFEITQVFVLNRMILFLSPFVMICFAYGFYYILRYPFRIPKTYIAGILTVLFVIYAGAFLLNTPNYDYKPVNPDWYTSYFTQEELNAVNFLYSQVDNQVMITSDYFPYNYFTALDGNKKIQGMIEKNVYRNRMFGSIGLNSNKTGYSLLREGEFMKAGRLLFPEISYKNHAAFESEFATFDKVFSSGNNLIFFNQ